MTIVRDYGAYITKNEKKIYANECLFRRKEPPTKESVFETIFYRVLKGKIPDSTTSQSMLEKLYDDEECGRFIDLKDGKYSFDINSFEFELKVLDETDDDYDELRVYDIVHNSRIVGSLTIERDRDDIDGEWGAWSGEITVKDLSFRKTHKVINNKRVLGREVAKIDLTLKGS